MHAHRWKPEHRDALLARVTVLTAGTAIVGTVGAIALGAGLASATPVAAKKSAPVAPKQQSAPATTPATPSANSTSGASSTSSPLRARDIRVLVLNGTGVSGAAHAAGGDVSAKGFVVTGFGNYSQRVSQTVVGYPTGQEAAAKFLANALGVSTIVPAQTDGGLVLLIGGDWQGSQPQVVQAPQQQQQGGGNGGGGNGGGGNGGGTSGGS